MTPVLAPSLFSCPPDATLRDVLARIDQSSPHLFQLVVDKAGMLLGTVTDGDVRRAMLRGAKLEDCVRDWMHVSPMTGLVGQPEDNLRKLQSVRSSRAFLPILDGHGVVTEIQVRGRQREGGISSALVMAGGRGTRLGSLTQNVPKPLLPVHGRPILDHVLARIEEADATRVFISVHHFSDQIKSFIAARPNRQPVEFIEESSPLGTAGALTMMRGIHQESPVLVVNGDVITSVDFTKVHDFHCRHGLDATVCVAQHDIDVPFGVVRYGEDGLFEAIDEKPRISHFIAAGVYYLSPEMIALVPSGRPIDMPELLGIGRKIGLRIGLFPIHEYWRDLGRPGDLDAAQAELSSLDRDQRD
jgi:dTDP-glucose pyrophosphorylase